MTFTEAEYREPANITDALAQLQKLEGTQSVCQRFHQLMNTIIVFEKTNPDHASMCKLLSDRMIEQHLAYHLLIEGIVNEGLARNAQHGTEDFKEDTG